MEIHRVKKNFNLRLKSGYWQIPIHDEDKLKTAFCACSGKIMECQMMHFGLCNSPATLSRLMDQTLSGLAWEICIAYLNDIIIIFSKIWKEHLGRLRKVFQRIQMAGLKLNPAKSTLGQYSEPFLGHVFMPQGIQPNPRLLKTIQDIPTPCTVEQVRNFLGLARYY